MSYSLNTINISIQEKNFIKFYCFIQAVDYNIKLINTSVINNCRYINIF